MYLALYREADEFVDLSTLFSLGQQAPQVPIGFLTFQQARAVRLPGSRGLGEEPCGIEEAALFIRDDMAACFRQPGTGLLKSPDRHLAEILESWVSWRCGDCYREWITMVSAPVINFEVHDVRSGITPSKFTLFLTTLHSGSKR